MKNQKKGGRKGLEPLSLSLALSLARARSLSLSIIFLLLSLALSPFFSLSLPSSLSPPAPLSFSPSRSFLRPPRQLRTFLLEEKKKVSFGSSEPLPE